MTSENKVEKSYLVKSHESKWHESHVVEVSQIGPAIERAKERSVTTGIPHEVYEITLVGSSTIPKSDFIDMRDQAAS